MANKQIDMRKVNGYSSGTSKRQISLQLRLFRNTVTKFIEFLKRYRLTGLADTMTLSKGVHEMKVDKRKKLVSNWN